MAKKLNIFLNKKILIYGLGKSGYSAFKFLKNKNDVSLFDDFNLKIRDKYTKNKIISYKNILTTKFDLIIFLYILRCSSAILDQRPFPNNSLEFLVP